MQILFSTYITIIIKYWNAHSLSGIFLLQSELGGQTLDGPYLVVHFIKIPGAPLTLIYLPHCLGEI
jgi:hypothetical protein